ncbi:hypothetical protein NMY22_g19521 [Coprinellus aureogranulatus]|nr:hypothetical protein NMY22_g19521 [Coprinellus aureogranulatus]
MDTIDIIHAHPATKDTQNRPVPARFDTVLVNEGSGNEIGTRGRCVGRVRVIFGLPDSLRKSEFRNPESIPTHLAYIEWFTTFTNRPERSHGMFKISKRLANDGTPLAEVIPLAYIYRSVHLFPKFGPVAPSSWTSSNVLDQCSTFYLNPFTDRHLYSELCRVPTE